MYEWNSEIVQCFDGDKHFELSCEKYNEIKSKPLSSDYLLVNKNFNNKDMCIEDSYQSYIQMANTLKQETKGYTHFYKCGSFK